MKAKWRLIMSSTGFPINDLIRRKLQTTLTVLTLTLTVASTLFLLLFTNRLGLGITSSKGTLTLGLTSIFSQFSLFVGALIFVIGAVLTSFIVFLMMAQRTRDFGLIKAAGCPNSLVAGYFITELLTVTLVGCILGTAFGFLADFLVANLVFSGYVVPNFWFVPMVFFIFSILALFFGLRPILKASRMSPIDALSPVNYFGLTEGAPKHKSLSRRGITWRIALRSLYRRQSASLRIVFLLSIVFILLTISIAGGIIANNTTTSWVSQAVDKDAIVIADSTMINQYKRLLSDFSKPQESLDFNYSDPKLAVPDTFVKQLKTLSAIDVIDSRLVLSKTVNEMGGFAFLGQASSSTVFVGGNRQGESIVIGVNPAELTSSWSLKGQFLGSNDSEAVIGDSLALSLYVRDARHGIAYSDPLLEGVGINGVSFKIVGVCVDPLNNGFVTYVSLDKLANVTGINEPNILLVKLNASADPNTAIAQIESVIQASGLNLEVSNLSSEIEQNTVFLSSTWQTIMFLPFFTLASATICLVSFMMLSVDEQHQEFAILRAIGAKPRIIINISAIQSAIMLISSFGIGISFGIIITTIVLMTNPLITTATVLLISGWLISALAAMFILSLYPAYRLAKASILKIMT
jgi:ABC-type antimicrobial peptide transport system permease subunit